MHRCSRCGKDETQTPFSIRKSSGKPIYICKPCNAEKSVEYRSKHPEYNWRNRERRKLKTPEQLHLTTRKNFLAWKYGITIEQYNAMFEQQEGVCAICGQPETGKRTNYLQVDHDHNTGNVRGLLCLRYNRAIGMMEDSPKLLSKATMYLEEHAVCYSLARKSL